jgi:hypothetical protein
VRRELIRKHGDLTGKKLLVWVWNIRSLFLPEALQRVEPDKWELVDLPPVGSTPASGETEPGAEPGIEPGEFPQQFAARLWAYRQAEPVKGARLQEGQELLITIQPLDDVLRSEKWVGQTDFMLPEYYISDFRVLE